jgi:hypothetical protein
MLDGMDDDVVVDNVDVVVDEAGGKETCGKDGRPAASTATVVKPVLHTAIRASTQQVARTRARPVMASLRSPSSVGGRTDDHRCETRR